MFSLNSAQLDEVSSNENYPKEVDLPTIKIGRFVVDKRLQGKGFGKLTLQKIISLYIEASKLIGTIGLTVDAKDEQIFIENTPRNVFEFYQKYGFKLLKDQPERGHYPMILYTETIKRQFPSLFETPV